MDEAQSRVQIESIVQLLGDAPKTVVDVGCGDGRLLIPISVAGHNVVGIDFDSNAINACGSKCADLDIDSTLLDGDVFDLLPLSEQVDAIICCGQTLMLFPDIQKAVDLFVLFKESLKEDGVIILDDLPNDLWPEVAEGRWANGINEEGTLQLLWEKNDLVFTIREGNAVDAGMWQMKGADKKLRLWTTSSLALTAQLADLSVPEVWVEGAVLVMRPV